MVTILGVAAASFGLVMAVSPLLQVRRMWRRQSSKDVSLGYFAILIPGFCLWIAYGTARSDWALVVPNAVAVVVALLTVGVATYLRRKHDERDRIEA